MFRKKDVNHALKKSAAMMTASVMVLSAPSVAMAEGMTYRDREKEALKSLSEAMAADWDESVALMAENGNASNAEMELKLTAGDAGKSMLGMFTGMDFAWLNNVSLNMKASVADGTEAVITDLLLNDAKICTANMLVNMKDMMEYVQIPEMAAAWLKLDMNQTLEEEGAESAGISMQMADLMTDPAALFADGSEIAGLLERYGNIVIDHMQEGATVEEAVSIEGISEDCTMLEGLIYQDDAKEMVKDILTTAQTDEQLEALLTRWSEAIPDAGNLNEELQNAIAEGLEELNAEPEGETTEEANEYIASRIWVNADNKIVGREVTLCEGIEDSANVFTWKAPSSGDASALLLDMQSDGSGFTVSGSGQKTDGVMNGNYSVASDGVTIMEVAMENFNSQADGKGYPAGTFTITFPESENEEEYNPLSAFSFVFTLSSSSADKSVDMNLALLSSGVSLCDLNLHVVSYTDTVETISEENMETVYDMNSEEDMNAYMEAVTFDTIKANAEAAGMPADVITMIEESMSPVEEADPNEPVTELEDAAEETDDAA